jgi:hypothetical protein
MGQVIFWCFEALVLQVPLLEWELAFRLVSMIRRKNWTELVLWFTALLIGQWADPLPLLFGISREASSSCREIGEGKLGTCPILHITWIAQVPSSPLDHCRQISAG